MRRVSSAARGPRLRLHHGGDDHRAAAELVADPAADDAAHDLLELLRVGAAVRAVASSSACSTCGMIVVEDRVVLGERRGRGSPGRPTTLPVGGVDHDEDRDEALVAEDAAVLEVGAR